MNDLIGVAEAHQQSGITYETIYAAAKNGRIEGAKQLTAGRVWVFPLESFKTWMQTHRPYNRRNRETKGQPV